ncbi:MAG: hypothetical protein ACJ8FY_13465 [Gemmataceae bacterium]
MAVTSKSPSPWPSRLHFLVRLLGLTGLVAAGVGLFLAVQGDLLAFDLGQIPSTGEVHGPSFGRQIDLFKDAVAGEGGLLAQITVCMLLAGCVAALVALLVELVVLIRTSTGRRSASGLSVVVQGVLATILLIGVNVFSFRHYLRLDWTRDAQFTLPDKTQKELRELTGSTTLVVYKRHKTFGTLNDKPDEYDYEAERKVVEKVNDLVEQFRQFGPQFNVVVLDVEEKGFDRKREELTKSVPELRKALDEAPENSIFFYAKEADGKGKVQRLSFNQFYQLDKNASKAANNGLGNLVLRFQSIEPFARRVLNIDDKKPTIGIAVVHELLTTKGGEEFYALAGLRKTLTEQGFNVEDIVLKKWSDMGPPEPGVATFEEYRFEDLEEQLADMDAGIKGLEAGIKEYQDFRNHVETASLNDLSKEFAKQLRGRKLEEKDRREQVNLISQEITLRQAILDNLRQQREEAAQEKVNLPQDTSGEQRRLTDLKAKFERLLAKCDLLIVPRMTIRNAALGEVVPPSIHNLDQAQVAAIRDFMKAGKPVLACLGPSSEPPNSRLMAEQKGPDGFEEMLTELGFHLNTQTVLFNDEAKSFAQRRTSFLTSSGNVQIPPVKFDWIEKDKAPNPIRASMMVAEASLGQNLDLSIRNPRPISFDPDRARLLPFDPDFMRTSERSWNDDNPFPSRERTPHAEPTKPGDPLFGTPDAKRYGPFTVGAAVKVPVPATWYSETPVSAKDVRVAVIGQGHWFVGNDLPPAKQRLLLDTTNWLLGRDDELLHEGTQWSYPRVVLSDHDANLWHWGTQIGLPALFAYLGVVVLMVRRLR